MRVRPQSESLPRRLFGSTGLLVTLVCIGGGPLGNMEQTFQYTVPEERALATIRAVFHSPINFLDTAASYGDGESERRIGQVLRELGGLPPGYVLASKADRDLQTGDFSGDQMRRSVERSLGLLGLERLLLCYLHDPENTTFEQAMSKGGPVEGLLKLKDEGLIKHLGVAGGPIGLEMHFVDTGLFEALITHNRFTLVDRTADPLIDLAASRGMAIANAAAYGGGILAKGANAYPRYAYQDAAPDLVEQVRRIETLCQRYNVPLAAAALQFSTRDPRIHSTIVGISRPERVQQTVGLARHPIPDELWPQIDAITGNHPDAGLP